MSNDGDDKVEKGSMTPGVRVFTSQGGPFSLEEHHRNVIEQTFKLNRLYVAASLLGGLVAQGRGVIFFSDAEMDTALQQAERLMRANDARKVVM